MTAIKTVVKSRGDSRGLGRRRDPQGGPDAREGLLGVVQLCLPRRRTRRVRLVRGGGRGVST
jgi:hypothetical protein